MCGMSERHPTPWYVAVAFVIAGLNFVSFVIVALWLGGDAGNGREEGGRYFLSQHGRDTEVSRWVFVYSRVHGYTVVVTHIGALLAGAAIQLSRRNGYSTR
jgi:hypothetical protein